MDYNDYEKFAATLAIYPHVGEGVFASILYPTFGLIGESGEVVDKIDQYLLDKDVLVEAELQEIKKELGDILWYITRTANELGLSLQEAFEQGLSSPIVSRPIDPSIRGFFAAVGDLSERLKKAMRDDNTELFDIIAYERMDAIRLALYRIVRSFAIILKSLGFTLEEVAEANVLKLSARKAKGTINGDGDNR